MGTSTSARILFVTTFNDELFEMSGRRLIESFYEHQDNDWSELLTCYEGYSCDHWPSYDLDVDAFLQEWLADNADVIPVHLGGETTQCACRNSHERHCKHHVNGCHWHWMNRNASRWFRKVASLRYAASLEYRYLMWVDCDTEFKQTISMDFYVRQFAGQSIFYCRGHREAPEVGVFGVDLDGGAGGMFEIDGNGGQGFIRELCHRYESREYLDYHRWDDGFQIGALVDAGLVTANDLVHPTRFASGPNYTNDVIPHSAIGEFIKHDKGRHGRKTGVML